MRQSWEKKLSSMKRLMLLLMLGLCSMSSAMGELVTDNDDGTTPTDLLGEETRANCVVDLIAQPDAVWAFAPSTPILEVVFPAHAAADVCILRMGDQVLMIDAGGEPEAASVAQTLQWLGVDHVQTGLSTHPHRDHMPGFSMMAETVQLDRVLTNFGYGSSPTMKTETERLRRLGVPLESIQSGDTIKFAGLGEQVTVFRTGQKGASVNDRSLMTMVTYGERSMLFLADVGKSTQWWIFRNPPARGLSADVIKYPHHGVARMHKGLLEAVHPCLAVITNSPDKSKHGTACMADNHIPVQYTHQQVLRLRTDGIIWVMDALNISSTPNR